MSASMMSERRREVRIAARLSVCIWGVDAEGNKFEQNVTATNVSGNGALLIGVESKSRFGDLIGIAHKGAKARFRIVWIKDVPPQRQFKVAVQKLEGHACPWRDLLPMQKSSTAVSPTVADSEEQGQRNDAPKTKHRHEILHPERSYRQTRRWTRHKVDVPIRVIVQRASKTSIFDGRGNELSEGGMALTAGVELNLGDLVGVEFTPPYSGSPIRHRGVVRNRMGYRYGIEFLADNDRDAEQTDRLLTMLTSM